MTSLSHTGLAKQALEGGEEAPGRPTRHGLRCTLLPEQRRTAAESGLGAGGQLHRRQVPRLAGREGGQRTGGQRQASGRLWPEERSLAALLWKDEP